MNLPLALPKCMSQAVKAAGLVIILTSGDAVWMAVHNSEVIITESVHLHDLIAPDFHASPAHAQISYFQEYFRTIQSFKDKGLKLHSQHEWISSLYLLQQYCPAAMRYSSGIFLYHQVPIRMLHCCYRI